jgi:[ribosomal protein S18]-alanine N-acetyltransferase
MNSTTTIRRAHATDLPTVYAGEHDYIRQIEPEQEMNWSNGMRFHLRQWTENLERMFIAEHGSDTAGYCFWQIDGDAAVLASIYVIPTLRGRAIGQLLLAQFITDAHAQGFNKLTLGVKDGNPAQRLYEKAGFVFTHEEHGYQHYLYPNMNSRL